MAEQLKEESQKTVVSFVVGLLVGGLLVWAFAGGPDATPKEKTSTTDKKEVTTDTKTDKASEETVTSKEDTAVAVGEGSVKVDGETKAGMSVPISDVTFPAKEGWVGVRNLNDGKLGLILGVARFSADQGLKQLFQSHPLGPIVNWKTEMLPMQWKIAISWICGYLSFYLFVYAIVFYSESGDRKFNTADDVQTEGDYATFTAK